jgi:aminoglycoside phosphotransferase (APT) family kinase protein
MTNIDDKEMPAGDDDMAAQFAIPTPWRREVSDLRGRFVNWFAHVLPPGAQPQVSDVTTPEGTGMSSETMLVDVTWTEDGQPREGRFVARLAPDESSYPVFPSYDLEMQGRCMTLVAQHTDVPVPKVHWYEPDPQWLGGPFLVTNRITGRAAPDLPPYVFGGWLYDSTPEQRALLQRNTLGVMARLHTLTPQTADLAFLDRPALGKSGLDQHMGYQRSYYEWAREGVDYPIIERTFEWLERNRPAEEGSPVLNWGDARIGNILFDGFEPVAVLDWEMAALGPPEVDVAWTVFMHSFFQDIATTYQMPGLPDFMRRDQVVEMYQEQGGRPLNDLRWYEAYGALRMGIVSVRTTMRSIIYGQTERPENPDDVISFCGVIEKMLDGSWWE